MRGGRLDADTCAIALIAAARAGGFDPLKAFDSHTRMAARTRITAAVGLVRTGQASGKSVCRALGLSSTNIAPSQIRSRGVDPDHIAVVVTALNTRCPARLSVTPASSAPRPRAGIRVESVPPPMVQFARAPSRETVLREAVRTQGFRPASPAPGAAVSTPILPPADSRGPAASAPIKINASAAPTATVGQRILAMLNEGAHTPVALSSRLGVKELVIGQELSQLQHAGHVAADPLGENGLRARLWRRVGG